MSKKTFRQTTKPATSSGVTHHGYETTLPAEATEEQELEMEQIEAVEQTPLEAEPEQTHAPISETGLVKETPVQAFEANNLLHSSMIDPKLKAEFDYLNEQFDDYREHMRAGRPISEADGAKYQVRLYRLIESVLRKEGETFTALFSQLLTRFNEERRGGVLDERLRFRFFGALPMGTNDCRNFEAILSALITLSNPKERALRIKQVDLKQVFSRYSNPDVLMRVADYFGV